MQRREVDSVGCNERRLAFNISLLESTSYPQRREDRDPVSEHCNVKPDHIVPDAPHKSQPRGPLPGRGGSNLMLLCDQKHLMCVLSGLPPLTKMGFCLPE